MIIRHVTALTALILFGLLATSQGAEPGWKILPGHVPEVINTLSATSRLPATNELRLAIGLPLRDPAGLDKFLADVYNPASPNYRHFLTPEEFTARFSATEADYAAVKTFALTNGFKISGEHGNRILLDVVAKTADVERAFHLKLNTFKHPTEAREFFAPDTEPSVNADLAVVDIQGLSDYWRPHPRLHKLDSKFISPKNGSAPDGSGAYFGNDFRNAYAPGATLTGAGQQVGLFQLDGYYANDIAVYAQQAGGGRTNIQVQTVPVGSTNWSIGVNGGNGEVSLDIEMAMAMAPGLSKILVFEGPLSAWPNDVLNAMAASNTVKNLSSSWGWSGGPQASTDAIFQTLAAQGQSFFNASGDSDAFTVGTGRHSPNGVDKTSLANTPSSSPYITQVGGTTLVTDSNAAYTSETVWNWGLDQGSYVGSSGGVSSYYLIPSWQTNISMTANLGSTTHRNIPDVALTADNVYVISGGSGAGSGGWGGTSCAAPLWAGFMALANQQLAAITGSPTNSVGFINPAVYAIGKGLNLNYSYAACFHDTRSGNNYWPSSPTNYPAVAGYDLCTGWGTPNGTNLINAFAPPPLPYFISQPASQTVTNGANVTFSATAGSASPMSYSWLFNGTNLSDGGNISGSASNILSISLVTTNNSGSYQLAVSNLTGTVTSQAAVLNVGSAPAILTQPTNLTLLSGGNAIFSATVTGSTNLVYQWRKNGSNLADGAGISGATSNLLTLTAVTTNGAGNYTLSVTNIFGATTSSVASLTVVLPPAITGSTLTNRSLQCGGNTNTFTVTASGTPTLNYQWSLDGAPVANATNANYSVTNLHLPNHTVSVTITNLYGSLVSNAVLAVQDTLAPVITLNGASRMTNELGSAFTDPGAVANDLCAGALPVTTSGNVNIAVVGTNLLTYTVSDGNGNSATNIRTVIVRDTTPPTISWSFTNLVLAADSNCVAVMPNVTGTNFILATDLSGALTITQNPPNNTALTLGTNTVVITVADASGNKSFSTNRIVVLDQTPPQILIPPQSQTNTIGGSASFSVAATACSPLTFQWYFGNAILLAQTNGSLTLSNLNRAAGGNYSVVVTASGGSTTSSVALLTVNPLASTILLASSENPSGFKDSLNFTASVTPTNATGAVQFFTNGTAFDLQTLVTGSAVSTNLASLPRGTNLVTAVYSGDANDLPSTNALMQIVTNHPPVAAPAFYTLVAGLDLNIAVADLTTNWSDADDDPLTLVGVNPSTNGVVVNDAGKFLFYTNANYVDDQFVCIISDGFGGTNFQAVNITVVPQTNATPAINAVTGPPDGGFTLQLEGGYGSTYILESTTDFVAGVWLPLATNTPGITGIWQFTDFGATNIPSRFYRLRLVP